MTSDTYKDWECVIGLEVHVQLNTKTKMFSPAPNHFGSEPNTNIGIVDTAQPGALPRANKVAIEKAILFGLATDAEIAEFCHFDRKSYFYPDSPRNFQITQFEHPIVIGGKIVADVGGEEKTFTIHHAHLEDDAGMLKHFSQFAGVDYNRAGVPLIEIVSDPCMRSPKEAAAYAMQIRAIMEYLDASDCNMEEGSLRMDANVSVRKRGEPGFRPKTELKNMNSFTNMELAIQAEMVRQIELYEKHPDKKPEDVLQSGTYRYDLATNRTILMRRKESSDDYRYFPEPDLPPLYVSKDWIEYLKKKLPELPRDRKRRYVEELGLTDYSANLLINDVKLCNEFEKGLTITKNPVAFCNWLTVEFIGRIKDTKKSFTEFGLSATNIANLVNMIEKKEITGKIAKQVADLMVEDPSKTPEEIVAANPHFKPLTDMSQIEGMVDQVLSENPDSIASYKNGKDRAFNFLVGQVMKLCKGSAPPDTVRDLVQKKIEESDI